LTKADYSTVEDYEVVAQELSELGERVRGLDDRVTEVERVNARLEEAALSTARALGEVSRHWDAVYEAMRRVELADARGSVERDHAAARARRAPESGNEGPND
jgi:predicted nuclease with TOPRIM domain